MYPETLKLYPESYCLKILQLWYQNKMIDYYLYKVSGSRFSRTWLVFLPTVTSCFSPYSILYPVISDPWQHGSSHWIARHVDKGREISIWSSSSKCSTDTGAGTDAGVVTTPASPNSPTPATFTAWERHRDHLPNPPVSNRSDRYHASFCMALRAI